MFTVHDSVPLSLHLQEWSLVSHMAVWVEEGGEHDLHGGVCSVTVAQNRRYNSQGLSCDPVFLATVEWLHKENKTIADLPFCQSG